MYTSPKMRVGVSFYIGKHSNIAGSARDQIGLSFLDKTDKTLPLQKTLFKILKQLIAVVSACHSNNIA